MKQAVMTSPGVIEFRDVPSVEPGAGEVAVRIMRIGVCGSDIHVYHGKHPYTSYPVVQGHEVSGEVTRVGAGVTGFAPGDRVTVRPQVVCGQCYPCRHGDYHICDSLKVMGFQTTGAASEYFTLPAANLLKLPAGMSFDHGAMIEPVAVAVHALGRYGDVKGKKVLVLGAGPIGNLVAQVAKARGAAQIMITDISDFRLSVAKKCGIPSQVNTRLGDLAEGVKTYFGADKADVILDCAGVGDSMDSAIANARKGSDIVVVGVFSEKPRIDLGLVQDRELRLIGTLMYKEEDYKEAISLVSTGLINLDALITGNYAFGDYIKAYEFIELQRDKAVKILIDVDRM